MVRLCKKTTTKQEFSRKEVKYLKESYKKNPYPNKQTTIQISEHLAVSQNRVTNWFYNQRVKLGLGYATRTQLFNPKELKYLKKSFEKNPCPNKQARIQISEHLGMSQKRVQNWFYSQHGRLRSQFSPKEHKYLKKVYEKDSYPNKQTRIQISEHLGTSQDRVKNWFGHYCKIEISKDLGKLQNSIKSWFENKRVRGGDHINRRKRERDSSEEGDPSEQEDSSEEQGDSPEEEKGGASPQHFMLDLNKEPVEWL